MKLLQVIFLLFSFGQLYSQADTVLIKTFYPDKKTFEEYQITIKDSLRNGTYKNYSAYGKILSEGKYVNDEKVGLWIYYSNGTSATEIVEKYNHSTQTEVYYNYTYEEYIGSPRYPGGFMALNEYVIRRLHKDINKLYIEKYNGQKLEVTFSIDRKSGEVFEVQINPRSNQINDPELENIVILIFKKQGRWTLSKTMTEKTNVGFSYTYPIKFKS